MGQQKETKKTKKEFTFHNANGSSTIDLSVCSAPCNNSLDFEILESAISYHSPIMTKLSLTNNYLNTERPTEYITRIKWDTNKRQDFAIALKDELSSATEINWNMMS